MVGQTLGHYRILERVGAGGMGVVYRARDEQLERDVAVKVLPPGTLSDETARRHFRKEAMALAKLSHPNIETVYEYGTQDQMDFLVLEYVPGKTLANKLAGGPLAEKEIVALGMQIAAALEEAHERGIVHRDLKPANVAITSRGEAKVLDFGLAKLLRPDDELTTDQLTETGMAAGTLPYMSPEQLRGEEVDARADVYAIGTVLYEMATGRKAFHEGSAPRLTDAILHEPPVPPRYVNPRISAELERIILKCLDKEAENRYQSARELVIDMRRVGSRSAPLAPLRKPARIRWKAIAILSLVFLLLLTTLIALNVGGSRGWLRGAGNLPRIKSLAVLPLANLSGDPTQEYFADGMTDALITDLGKIGALRVISRTSVMQYKGASKPVREIAKDLSLDAVVEGSLLRSGDRVQITARLIQARTDTQIWSHSYERGIQDALTLQSEVAQAIADEIRVKLTPEEQARISASHAVSPEAYEAYLRGRYFWNKRTPGDFRKAMSEFKKAIDLDPTYPLAWAGLADGYSLLSDYDEQSPREAIPQARATAKKALELDDSLGEAWATLANIEWAYDWNASAAETDFRRAIALSPNYASAHQWYGMHLCDRGRFDDGIAELERAQALDPLSLVIEVNVGRCRYYGRRYDQAAELLQPIEQREPDYWIVHAILGQTYLAMGRLDDAIRKLERANVLSPDSPRNLGVLGDAYGRAGRRGDALMLARELTALSRKRYIPPIYSAMIYMGLGERPQAIAFLEKAYADRSNWMVLLDTEPEFDSLRSDPRFRDLVRRIADQSDTRDNL
jgi:eukaryotic-like serine/threonine-protein kinase